MIWRIDLATTQCPLCFHIVPYADYYAGYSIIGECPHCHRDTRQAIFQVRYPWRSVLEAFLAILFGVEVELQHADQFPH
jgi:hypothetical protein